MSNSIFPAAPAAAATNKPTKSEGRSSVSLSSLFDDLKDDAGTPQVKEEVKKAAPGVKKLANWDLEDAKGNTADIYKQHYIFVELSEI